MVTISVGRRGWASRRATCNKLLDPAAGNSRRPRNPGGRVGARPKPAKGQEAFINVEFVTKEKSAWAPKGHIVAWDQIALTPAPKTPAKFPTLSAAVTKSAEAITLSAAEWQLSFDAKTGFLNSLSHAGIDRIVGPARS